MFECAALGCSVRVSHRGQLCGMCAEQPQEDFDYDDYSDDDDDDWECAYPGSCLMPDPLHHRSECHTVADMNRYYAEMEGLKSK